MTQEQHVRILRGLQGSGKSTIAHQWVAEDPDFRIRINRDDIRHQLYNKYWGLSRHQEETVTAMEQAMAEKAIGAKMSIIIDATNLRARTVKDWYAIANKFGIPAVVQDVETPLEECIARDKVRDRVVGEDVIRNYYSRYFKKGKMVAPPMNEVDAPLGKAYIPNPDLPKAVWVDVDGTVAKMVSRKPFEWHKVGEDEPIHHVIEAVQALKKDGYKVVVMSGRDEVCKSDTEEWLLRHGIEPDDIFMRPADSYIPDDRVKHDLFWEHVAPKYDVRFALDDRDKVVKFTREVLNIPVFQVQPGAF